MTHVKHSVLAIALIFAWTLVASAQAQTLSVEVLTDSDRAQFAVQGEAQAVRVEIFSPSGEKVFDSGVFIGQTVEWSMTDQKRRRVEDGLYLASITLVDATGKVRKRVEQVSVSRPLPQKSAPAASAPPPDQAIGPISGEGSGSPTSGRLARFTDTNQIGDSIMVESANRLIINPLAAAPNAVLQVNGLQPAPSVASGTHATALLTTTGGKGGDTTGSGKTGGRGASISLLAGNGGNAVAGSTNGGGGSITLQPGSPGTGGVGGYPGNVLIAPMAGNFFVGIGTSNPRSKLHVISTIFNAIHGVHTGSSGNAGVFGESDYGYGVSGQSDEGSGVFGRTDSVEAGVYGYNGGNGIGVEGYSSLGYAIYSNGKAKVTRNLEVDGNVGIGTNNPGVKLDVRGTTSGVTALIRVQNSGSGYGTYSYSGSGTGILGTSDSGKGVAGFSSSGYAGYFQGKARVTGLLEVNGGCNGCSPPSERNLKANFSSVNPRLILDRLASIPIQTWNYKSEPDSVRHIGAMAKDFRAAFNFGEDDKTLNTVDAQGVTMAAIQGLYQQNQELLSEVRRLQARLARVERAVKKRRVRRGR